MIHIAARKGARNDVKEALFHTNMMIDSKKCSRHSVCMSTTENIDNNKKKVYKRSDDYKGIRKQINNNKRRNNGWFPEFPVKLGTSIVSSKK